MSYLNLVNHLVRSPISVTGNFVGETLNYLLPYLTLLINKSSILNVVLPQLPPPPPPTQHLSNDQFSLNYIAVY